MAACRWRSAALQSPGAGHGSGVPPEELLARIQDFIKEFLSRIKDRSMLVISLDKFRMRKLRSSEDTNLGIFERCEAQENLSLQTSGRRILAMLRVLQIVQSLLQQGKHASKRDLYYTDPGLFKDQATVNQALIDISVRLKCTRSSLHVVSVGKGLIMGSLRFKDADRTIDCSVCKSRGYPIPTDAKMVTDISSCAEYIIVVEKETVFQRLANDGFCRKNNCIVLTGRGYPDVATRSFLRLLAAETKLPVYGLVDADPYGLDILATYRFGSPTMAYDAEALATPSIRWLGVFLSDCQTHNVPDRCLLSLTNDASSCG
ncbi:meiotic recombination protein SPO11-1 isoform X2 [Selaginella moellendorffii]|uniref:meiotic recombination protein SPO11-1 isoform X2 n=1 Tax=Selaginella moellendorffii TaxID=88036 RepID=UPI000D1CD7FC|nr:meiotic recombination protein SPO11-1 isoform X2 [Selaginella moellendorffii]|eukprot:XP_024515669.1 meiotic recombination protein SPO11-1 isoform X2 [Selaginella moellendorffii]